MMLFLSLCYTLVATRSLLLPMVVALFFSFLLSPVVKGMKKLHVPRGLSAIVLVFGLTAPFSLLSLQLVEPAEKWLKMMPHISEEVGETLKPIEEALSPQRKNVETREENSLFSFFRADDKEDVQKPDESNMVSEKITQSSMEMLLSFLTETPVVIAQFCGFLILLLFFLTFGPRFYRTFIDVMPWITDKVYAHHFFEETQSTLSRYIGTITVINASLGAIVGGILAAIGTEDAILWAVLVALLNFIPYIGPLIGISILGLAGAVQHGISGEALLPAAIYFLVNLVESQVATPLILGRHMSLNPMVVLVWLIIWGWLWGFVGLLVAVPLLVCVKLSLARFNLFPGWVELIEAGAHERVNQTAPANTASSEKN